jgi:hypothetical protein
MMLLKETHFIFAARYLDALFGAGPAFVVDGGELNWGLKFNFIKINLVLLTVQ